MKKEWDPDDPGGADAWETAYNSWLAREQAARDALAAATEANTTAQQTRTTIDEAVGALATALSASDANAATLAQLTGDLAATTAAITRDDAEAADRAEARDAATARLLGGPGLGSPVTLLPVGLHTSWQGRSLRVRILPDALSLSAHDERPTQAEANAVAGYRAAVAAGQADQAWADLVRRVGAARAAWLVQTTTGSTGSRSWTDVAAHTALLPDRFAVVAYAAGEPVAVGDPAAPTYVTWGEPLAADPLAADAFADPSTPQWHTDFAEAGRVGLAVTIDVPTDAPPIDELVAVGLRTGTGGLGDLLTEQAWSAGLEVLPDGTPTNNTDAARSALDPGHEAVVAAELVSGAAAGALGATTAGGQLAAALGVDPAVLLRVTGSHADPGPVADAVGVLVGLGATGPLGDGVGTGFAAAWPLVSPAGPAPSFRVGPQPYGVLPATVPRRWRPAEGESAAAAAPLLAAWSRRHLPALDVDPGTPTTPQPAARRATLEDESALAQLLLETPASLAWGDHAGTTGLVGDPGFLTTLARTDTAGLRALDPGPALLARVALAAKRSASASARPAVDAALRTLVAATASEAGRDDVARRLAAALDCLSHRVDGWVTAVATERLRHQRAAAGAATGAATVGAYGYVTDVAPRRSARSAGHVHAPSLGQAATAAVLRSGYLAEQGARAATGTTGAPALAIDLSSRRMRAARTVLTAVRRGLPLGAVLGYRFEQALTDAGLAGYLPAFRKLTRFSTGSHLEELEGERAAAEDAEAAARVELARLQRVAAEAALAAGLTTAPLAAAQAAQRAAEAAAAPYVQMQQQLASVSASIPGLQAALAAVNRARPAVPAHHIHVTGPKGSYDVEVTDPLDSPAVSAWADQQAAAASALLSAQNEAARLTAALAAAPAVAARAAVTAAQEVTSRAQAAAETATTQAGDAAQQAARYEASTLAGRTAALNAAVAAVATELASLLRNASTSSALSATVDGLALRARYRAALGSSPAVWNLATVPFRSPGRPAEDPQIALPTTADADYPRLRAALDVLDDLVDAVTDLITAEGVHHLVTGNPVRSGAALDVAASGTLPDDFDVLRTPTSGYDLTHRVVVLMPSTARPAWSAAVPGAADTADPTLSAWVSRLLPDPKRVDVTALRRDPESGALGDDVTFTADALGLGPLDWLRVAADPGELAARLAATARDRWAATGKVDATTGAVVVSATAADPGKPGLADLVTAARSVRTALTTARALETTDLGAAGSPGSPDPASATAAIARLAPVETLVAATLRQLAKPAVLRDPAKLRAALLDVAALGIAEGVPDLTTGTPELSVLVAQAEAAHARLAARLAPGPVKAGPDPAATLSAARERATALCGFAVPLLLPLSLPTDRKLATDLGGGSVRIPGADATAVRRWLLDHARVRPACAALVAAYDGAAALESPAVLRVRATHRPSTRDSVAWAGASATPPVGIVNLVAVCDGSLRPAQPVVGLAIDTWTQTVPDGLVHGGVTFHYDRPNASPPQAVLVAVAPDVSADRRPATWDLDTLLETVRSTVALAGDRARAAELDPAAQVMLATEPDGGVS